MERYQKDTINLFSLSRQILCARDRTASKLRTTGPVQSSSRGISEDAEFVNLCADWLPPLKCGVGPFRFELLAIRPDALLRSADQVDGPSERPIVQFPTSSITLRPFTPADRFLLNRWLGAPDVVAWFGSRGAADAEIALAQSSPSSLLRIICFDATPIGYAQAFDVGLTGAPSHASVPAGSYGADVFIGSDAHRGLGYGATALALLAADVFATTFALAVVIQVPIRREMAVRRIERAGFSWRAVLADPLLGPVWIMRMDRR